MRRKLGTRFPASRIKKIMQADEDVGKIALAVPVLVSKALELFLQDLCDRTYEITLQRGAKTMSSSHLKHCVQTYSAFDFLRESMKKVPDIGGSDPRCVERNATRRRKVSTDEDIDTSEGKRLKTGMMMHHPGRRGRGRGRGRGRSASSCRLNEEISERHDDDLVTSSEHCDEQDDDKFEKVEDRSEEKENASCTNSKTAAESFTESKGPNVEEAAKVNVNRNNEYLVWADMDNMDIEPSQFLHLNKTLEPEEDYDNCEE